MRKFLLLIATIAAVFPSKAATFDTNLYTLAQQDSIKRQKRNVAIVLGTEGAICTGVLVSLYSSWYSGSETGSFHWFNDNGEWLQMDKFGHANSCYNFGVLGYESLRLAGWDEKHSILFGGPLGLAVMTCVEIFDGMSANWGFSWGDMGANIFGTGLFMVQQACWHEQRIALKYSYHRSPFVKYDVSNRLANPLERDYIMGNDFVDYLYEDYNGSTIWLAFDIKSLLMKKDSKWPSWLGFAFGYGGEGMTGEYNNFDPNGPVGTNGNWGRGWENPRTGNVEYYAGSRNRQFFLAPDIDISRIPCKNKNLKHILRVLSAIKLPTPTIEYQTGGVGWKWHWLYF